MAIHIIKLCVGADTIEDLASWQAERLKERRKKKLPAEIQHVTRMKPTREAEVLDGGSLYWVIKGQIAVRQKILGFKPATKKGIPHCGIVLHPDLVPVSRRMHRAFQGWRYLDPKDAPRDITSRDAAALPEELQAELASLGLL